MFFSIDIMDVIDIFLVALILYYIYRLMRASRSMNVFIGIMVFTIVWILVSKVLGMRLMGNIMDTLMNVGVLALIVLFQDEIRKFLYNLGEHQRVARIKNLFSSAKKPSGTNREAIMPIVMACRDMSRDKIGALIVIERSDNLSEVVRSGEIIDGRISKRLIQNIFFKNSPLHDGAMVISNNRIKAAACILTVSHDLDIPKELGLRHRAALGISQETDALAIVVSEETGRISAALRGELRLRLSAEELEGLLTQGNNEE